MQVTESDFTPPIAPDPKYVRPVRCEMEETRTTADQGVSNALFNIAKLFGIAILGSSFPSNSNDT